MCIFSRPVDSVSETNIFARGSINGRQFLVYSMNFRAAEDLAMILPLPTHRHATEDAVSFLDLSKYPGFFEDMRKGFPEPAATRGTFSYGTLVRGLKSAPLPVVDVGNFEASFVPALEAFNRLDPRFKLPEGVWDEIPQYRDYGFAVFKLKKTANTQGKAHPMAFEFPRANPHALFFPTVHIHDGAVHPNADFDHSLFAQVGTKPFGWEISPVKAKQFMDGWESKGLIDPDAFVLRKKLVGIFDNEDVTIPEGVVTAAV